VEVDHDDHAGALPLDRGVWMPLEARPCGADDWVRTAWLQRAWCASASRVPRELCDPGQYV